MPEGEKNLIPLADERKKREAKERKKQNEIWFEESREKGREEFLKWINEGFGWIRINKILELSKERNPEEIEKIKKTLEPYQSDDLKEVIETASLEQIKKSPSFYRVVLEFILYKHIMTIEDLEEEMQV